MRRSDFIIKLMSVVLFIAIAAYIGIYIFNAADKPLVTALAVRYTVEDSGGSEGYIVRNETVLMGGGSTVTLLAGEGEKVAVDQAVAVHYEGEAALERASEIRSLQLQIDEAESDAALSAEQRTSNAAVSIFALSNAVQHKDLSNLESLTLSIEKTVFTDGAVKISDADLAELRSRLTYLQSGNSDTTTVLSPASGVFSSAVDGYEAVGPDRLTGLTPSSLQALFAAAQSPDDEVLGKLITGITWYYAAVMDTTDARKLADKDTAALQFTKTYNGALTMTIESIGAEEEGKCVVLFSAKRDMSEMTTLRRLTAEVEFSSFTGLAIPKEAVYHENEGNADKTFIYLLTGLQAEKVYVDILSENGDSFIVKDGTENDTVLREGSEIIVKAKDLYDGKVVGR